MKGWMNVTFALSPVADGERWPVPLPARMDGATYDYHQGVHVLTIVHPGLPRELLDLAADGQWRFGLYEHPKALFMLYENDIWDWGEAPYSWHRVPINLRPEAINLGPDDRIGMIIALVDGTTGRLSRSRSILLSPSFGRELHSAIRRQKEEVITTSDHDAAIAETFRRFPTADGMSRAASARCVIAAGGGFE